MSDPKELADYWYDKYEQEKAKALKWEQEASMYKSKVFKLDAKIMELEKKLNERS